MSGLPGPASDFVAGYLRQVRDLMIELFDVSAEEAEGRITTELGSFELMSVETENYLGHEDPDHWAHSIYYGADVQWWRLDPVDLRPKPWP